ncbi:efflux transporter periplasmic adaptor subunit [Hydrogenophaga crassostreae]|uniref:Efflux transporter periplasmic adaptor subunit n=1 Tax=Hydrogenophaga crassostreae TaxID=1763535 RepID=A0A167HKY1_9BURK|nr:efflux RND transporter periplasmic adaptor subunit [Hydrogenophaga crassostreae]AOW11622.1 efflux transporter periplasmic adaptor subunit [Hydrogenophaga crassostreae]OAD41376.1 efflux transporter periplasmic adaptor subunit [Hydrogenophaga crassostreae]
MKSQTRWILLVVALMVAGTLAWRSLPGGERVAVVPVVRSAIAQSVVATGRLNAPARLDIATEVTAQVLAVLVQAGDTVKAGDLLLRLADDEAQASLQQARAALAEAQARLRQQASVGAPVASQVVVQAQAGFEAARREHGRASELVAQGFFAQQKLDDAQRLLDTARSALTTARLQSEANLPGGVERRLAAARMGQASAQVALAQARLSRLRIVSPLDATVLSRQVEPGSTAQPGRVLLTLAASGGLRVEAAIDEKHLRVLKLGMAARAVADAYPGQGFEARLSYIAPAVDPQRGTVDVWLTVTEPPAFLKPDMTVSVELVGGARSDALVLPSSAVRDTDSPAPWVLLLRDGEAVRQPVTLGLRGVGSIEITEGVSAGEEAIPQTEKALPGDRVRRGNVLSQAVARPAG